MGLPSFVFTKFGDFRQNVNTKQQNAKFVSRTLPLGICTLRFALCLLLFVFCSLPFGYSRCDVTKIDPPVVTADSVCQYSVNSFNGGLKAACAACPANSSPTIIWYDAALNQVAAGSPFDPIKLKLVNTAVPGNYIFTAVCKCIPNNLNDSNLVSYGAQVTFKVIALPAPKILGNALPCPNETAIYVCTDSSANSNANKYTWSLSGGGVLIQNGNSVNVKWNGGGNSGPYTLTVREKNTSGCESSTDYTVNIKGAALSCLSKINISLNSNCQADVYVQDVLSRVINGASQMQLKLFWAYNAPVLESGLGSITIDGISAQVGAYDYKNNTFVYTVTENCTGNSCSGNIVVADNTPPVVIVPNDFTVSCADSGRLSLDTQNFASLLITDCSNYTTSYSDAFYDISCQTPFTRFPTNIILTRAARPTILPNVDIVRIIVRTFMVRDIYGNFTTTQQIIYVRKALLKNMVFPTDIEINFKDAIAKVSTGVPMLVDSLNGQRINSFPLTLACGMNVIYSDDTISRCGNSFTILRNWKILDACAIYDPTASIDTRFKYGTQIIKVIDKTPVIAIAKFTQYYVINSELSVHDTISYFDGVSNSDGKNVDGSVQHVYPKGLSSSCGASVHFELRAKIDTSFLHYFISRNPTISSILNFRVSDSRLKLLSGYPTIDASTGETIAIYEGVFDAYGDYNFTFYSADACGYATAKKTFIIHVRDNVKPQVVCASNIKVSLTSNKMAIITADQLNVGSTDNCAIQKILVRRISNCQNPTDVDFKDNVAFNCCDANQTIPVIMRVYDYFGNFNDCSVNVTVQDNLNVCPPVLSALSGIVQTENGITIEGVTVKTGFNNVNLGTFLTTGSGNFTINNLNVSQKVSTYATRDDNVQNGVTTYDIALLSRHILDIQPLSTAYKMIAADVNKDGDVNALDMLLMRRLVLHIIPNFPNNTAWRFIDKNYAFINPADPFSEDFPEVIATNIVKGTNTANFIGVKIGDLNNSAIANNDLNALVTRGVNTNFELRITTPDKNLKAGETMDIIFHTDKLLAQGFQFTLNTTKNLEILAVSKAGGFEISDNNFGLFENSLTLSWDGKQTNIATDIIKVTVRAKNSIRLSDALSISSNITSIEAFDENGKVGKVVLEVLKENPTANIAGIFFKLYQNAPNPFDSETNIGFDLPDDAPFKLTITNVQGQVIKVIENNGVRGYNSINLNKPEVSTAGLYFYRLESGANTTTLIMVSD